MQNLAVDNIIAFTMSFNDFISKKSRKMSRRETPPFQIYLFRKELLRAFSKILRKKLTKICHAGSEK